MPSAPNDQPINHEDGKKDSLEEKIHRHLNDKNDKITDEDIRDIVVGQPRKSAEPGKDNTGKTLEDEAKEMEDEIPKGKKSDAWDVLSGD